MDYHKILDFFDNPISYFEEIGEILDECHPFTEENRRNALASIIRGKVEKDLLLLKRDMLAEKSIHTVDYQNLLQESLTDAINKLQETDNWKIVRTIDIDKAAENLAKIGYSRLYMKRIVSETIAIRPVKDGKTVKTKMDLLLSKSGTWFNFIYSIDAEVDDYTKGFTWSAFCDFIEEEIISLPKSNGRKTSKHTEPIKFGFDSYLKCHAVKLLPYLIANYKDSRPRPLVIMLFVLKELGAIESNILDYDHIELHKALSVTFGDIGIPSALTKGIDVVKNPGDKERRKIDQVKNLIIKQLSL